MEQLESRALMAAVMPTQSSVWQPQPATQLVHVAGVQGVAALPVEGGKRSSHVMALRVIEPARGGIGSNPDILFAEGVWPPGVGWSLHSASPGDTEDRGADRVDLPREVGTGMLATLAFVSAGSDGHLLVVDGTVGVFKSGGLEHTAPTDAAREVWGFWAAYGAPPKWFLARVIDHPPAAAAATARASTSRGAVQLSSTLNVDPVDVHASQRSPDSPRGTFATAQRYASSVFTSVSAGVAKVLNAVVDGTVATVAAAVASHISESSAGSAGSISGELDALTEFVDRERTFEFAHFGAPFTLLMDSVAAFIAESASVPASVPTATTQDPTSRPWTVTFAVVAADVVVLSYIYRKRRRARQNRRAHHRCVFSVIPLSSAIARS